MIMQKTINKKHFIDILKEFSQILLKLIAYISFILYTITLFVDFCNGKLIIVDAFLRFSIALMLIIIFNIFLNLGESRETENSNEVYLNNKYLNNINKSWNIVLKSSNIILHQELSDDELCYNLAILERQKNYIESMNVPKKYQETHSELLSYINELLSILDEG